MSKNVKEKKNMKTLKIDITKKHPMYKYIDQLCYSTKNIYNTVLYYSRNYYIGTKNIKDGKENNKNVQDIVNDIDRWIVDYNSKKHIDNICIFNRFNDIQLENLESGDAEYSKKVKSNNDIISEYLKNNGIKPTKNDKQRTLLKIYNKWGGGVLDSSIFYKYLHEREEFKVLKSDTTLITIRRVDEVWSSYFALMNKWFKEGCNPKAKPGIPRYIKGKENGRYSYKAIKCWDKKTPLIKIDDKYSKLILCNREFKEHNIELKVPLSSDVVLKQVELTPRGDRFSLCIIYEDGIYEEIIPKCERVIAMDIGVNLLATCCNNIGIRPIAINGQPLKSYNKYWNKETSKYKSILKTVNDKYLSKRLQHLNSKRNNYMRTYMHKASTMVIKWCIENNIDTIIIGKNKGWKTDANMGKVQNQTFVQIPFARFIDMICYKANDNKIGVILQEESYTSKASFIDNDYIATYGKDDDKKEETGKRELRGQYISKDGLKIHADLNGAYNIFRKYDNKFTYGEDKYLHPKIYNII